MRRVVGLVASLAFIFIFPVLTVLAAAPRDVRSNGAVSVSGFSECGLASVYGTRRDGHAGSATASGERLDGVRLTAAHRTLPFGTLVLVRTMGHLGTGAAALRATVRINDRGPFKRGRVIDLSTAAARQLGFADDLLPVCLEVL